MRYDVKQADCLADAAGKLAVLRRDAPRHTLCGRGGVGGITALCIINGETRSIGHKNSSLVSETAVCDFVTSDRVSALIAYGIALNFIITCGDVYRSFIISRRSCLPRFYIISCRRRPPARGAYAGMASSTSMNQFGRSRSQSASFPSMMTAIWRKRTVLSKSRAISQSGNICRRFAERLA